MQLRLHGLFYLNLLNTNTHVCDFEIPLKGFGSSAVVDLVAVTLDLQSSNGMRMISDSDIEKGRHNTF